MTASLPVPNDIDPEEPDGHASAPVVRLPATVKPASDAHESPRKPRPKGGRKPAAKTKRPTQAATPVADPGPPPPLPTDLDVAAIVAADIVVPPKPPLPAPPTDPHPPAAAESGIGVPTEPETVPVEPEIKPEAEAEPQAEAEFQAETHPADAVAAERESESVPAAAVVEEEVAAPVELPTVVEAEDASAAPDIAPARESEPELEPELELELEPTAVPVVGPPAAAASGDVLVLRGVTKRFGGTHAVEGIDLTIPAGTFYGLVGPNGAGKTTTLSMIAGLLKPDRGTIRVGGVDAAAKPVAAKKLMGVLPDRLRTFDRLTGRQLLYYYGVLRGLSPAVVESRTADLARAFDLEGALGRSVSDYSAGMLKKVMLAGALIHSPRLLVLDEPFEAVDPVSSAIILDILSTYVAHGGTVILSSHGMELVERVCTRVAVLVAGQVLAEGTVDEVRGELTLEQRFVELAGGLSDVEGLEWLHTFSD
ncbi:ABC transporter ATP-binding protein [Microbacterium sp. I2]|uniref:ABC transporter ATP-binding protein n=1 Tax=Microbacterium sp. I2 TaxID=3391826 RepID=UPI003ED95F1D